MDFVGPIIEILPKLWNCTSNRIAIIRHLQENLTSLRQTRDELESISKDVRTKVDLAEQQYRKRTNQVDGWLERVQLKLEEVDNMLQKGEREIQKKCLGSCFVPGTVTLATSLIPVDKTVGMDSILNEVWRCLDGHQVRIIGMYGLGGVGKTTLLKKLNNKFIDKRHDVTWEKKTDEHSRATEICRSLSGKRFVLLLDDLWERIDLRNMGVPDLSYHQNGSKIVFTTRSEDVCHSMDAAVKKFEVKCLSFEKSFELFRQCVTEDVLNSHHQIREFSVTVAEECKGLPLALITIGRAMSNRRTPEEWRHAINKLRSQPSKFADMESHVFGVLRFSYESFRDEEHKNCFLYCSLIPEDCAIRKDELIDLWTSEGILHNYGLNDARDAGEFIIRSLKHACLLEMVGADDYVKMHDVLRDMALWLASVEENKIFVFENQESIKKHGIATWKEAVRISLWGRSVKLFGETPFCPASANFCVLKSICRVMHFPSLERIWVVRCPSLTKLPLDVFNENNRRISILGDKEWWDKLEWENSSSKVSYPSMHQTAPVSGLAAQSYSYNFPHFIRAYWPHEPSYTYEATKIKERFVLLKCLDDHRVRMIGIYGTGGVGKTTLLKKLNNKFIDNRLGFDLMIWVTVSKEVNLDGIQEVIRHKLQIPDETWKTKTDEHRCFELASSITELCEIAKECKGLPLALITIGRAMSNRRTPEEWRYGLNDTRDAGEFIIRSLKHACLLEMVGDSMIMLRCTMCFVIWLVVSLVEENKIFVFENQESIKKHGIATWKEAEEYHRGVAVLNLSEYFLNSVAAMLEMINLRYLNLSDTDIEELPIVASTLTKLRFPLVRWHIETQSYFEGVISSLSSPSKCSEYQRELFVKPPTCLKIKQLNFRDLPLLKSICRVSVPFPGEDMGNQLPTSNKTPTRPS
ncbi:hypothetical protein Patl1_34422 [Pistacia atlantica]|uniref:Uncharacterized protein n=1 Tax=Pistacia atlantica TaxID=434234 RepID=A0ACC0ZVA8_9ROSI|nr:hypothetical protein Patl1_34422 [Pistacia atlantica]